MIGKPSRFWGNAAGLTLMELLISLALMALIAIGITSSLGLVVRIYDQSEDLRPHSDPILYRLHLRHWLTNAISPNLLTPFPAVFSGSETSLEFVTLTETAFLPSAAAMRVKIVATGDQLMLITTALSDDGRDLDQTETVLADGLTNGRISYLDGASENAEWVPEWQSQATLPHAVMVTANQGTMPKWPDFIVQIVNAPPRQ